MRWTPSRRDETCSRRPAAARVAVIACLATALPAAAFNPQPDPPGFGMVGIVRDQTAGLSVVNIGGLSPPEPDAPVELLFLDGAGTTLARAVVTAAGGTAAFLDLRGDSLAISDPDERMQIRAVVRAVGDQRPSLVPTLELFDTATGRTTVSYPWAAITRKPLRFGSPRRADDRSGAVAERRDGPRHGPGQGHHPGPGRLLPR
jgi:hypothetical protein